MSDCPSLLNCIFFNDQMAKMPALASVLKSSYCKKDYANCARYMVAQKLGKEKVPGDLFPSHLDRAREIIS